RCDPSSPFPCPSSSFCTGPHRTPIPQLIAGILFGFWVTALLAALARLAVLTTRNTEKLYALLSGQARVRRCAAQKRILRRCGGDIRGRMHVTTLYRSGKERVSGARF